MKKNFFIFVFAVALVSYSNAQQWVGFTKVEPSAPELNLITNSNQGVSFDVKIPGVYVADTVVNGTAFTRLFLPGGRAINPAGAPEIPVLKYRVAIPECKGIDVAYTIVSQRKLSSCWVYPTPELVSQTNQDGMEILVQQFNFNPDAYTQPRIVEPTAVESENGAFRAQKYVEITVKPFEFCPVSRELSVIDNIKVSLTFNEPKGILRQNVGIFNKVAANTFINYEDDGISAIVNDKAFEKEGFEKGLVQWIVMNQPDDANNIVADYLIICEDKFFNLQNTAMKKFTAHRSFYNDFYVAIVSLGNILELNFEYEGNPKYNPDDPDPDEPWDKYIKEQKMRTFIRRVYEGANAPNTLDGKLGYVLLIGDNYEGNEGMPVSYDNGTHWVYGYDDYFACVTRNEITGKYDPFGSLFLGRFSVEDNEQLHNIVEKTLFFETEYQPFQWRKSVGFTYDVIYTNDHERDLLNCQHYFEFISDYLNGWNYTFADFHNDGWANMHIKTFEYFNNGVIYAQYLGHGIGCS